MMDTLQSSTTKNPSFVSIGARLKTAREQLQLSEKEAAGRLHLSVKIISLMENEEFNTDMPITFVRGYLRSYGRMLNISEKEINDAIEQLSLNTPTTKSLKPLIKTPVVPPNERYVKWITYLMGIVLVALVGSWWSSHSKLDHSQVFDSVKMPVVTGKSPEGSAVLSSVSTTPEEGKSESLLPQVSSPNINSVNITSTNISSANINSANPRGGLTGQSVQPSPSQPASKIPATYSSKNNEGSKTMTMPAANDLSNLNPSSPKTGLISPSNPDVHRRVSESNLPLPPLASPTQGQAVPANSELKHTPSTDVASTISEEDTLHSQMDLNSPSTNEVQPVMTSEASEMKASTGEDDLTPKRTKRHKQHRSHMGMSVPEPGLNTSDF